MANKEHYKYKIKLREPISDEKARRLKQAPNTVRYQITDPLAVELLGLKLRRSENYSLTMDQAKKWVNYHNQRVDDNRKNFNKYPSALQNTQNSAEPKPSPRVLYYDVEVAPAKVYTWGSGWDIRITDENIITDWAIMSIHYKWSNEDTVKNFVWDYEYGMDTGCDRRVLEQFVPLLNQADYIVAHYGDKFDIKKIRTRALLHGIMMRHDYQQDDTKKIASKYFKFDDNRLNALGRRFGIGFKDDMKFKDWINVMEHVPGAIEKMVTYGDRDVYLLEHVHTVMNPYTKQKVHAAMYHPLGKKYDCPRCESDKTERVGMRTTSAGTAKIRMQCTCCNHGFEISNRDWLRKVEEDSLEQQIKDRQELNKNS